MSETLEFARIICDESLKWIEKMRKSRGDRELAAWWEGKVSVCHLLFPEDHYIQEAYKASRQVLGTDWSNDENTA